MPKAFSSKVVVKTLTYIHTRTSDRLLYLDHKVIGNDSERCFKYGLNNKK